MLKSNTWQFAACETRRLQTCAGSYIFTHMSNCLWHTQSLCVSKATSDPAIMILTYHPGCSCTILNSFAQKVDMRLHIRALFIELSLTSPDPDNLANDESFRPVRSFGHQTCRCYASSKQPGIAQENSEHRP